MTSAFIIKELRGALALRLFCGRSSFPPPNQRYKALIFFRAFFFFYQKTFQFCLGTENSPVLCQTLTNSYADISNMHLNDYTFLQQIASLPFVDAIYLFGSRARGDHQDRSDIDIAVFCPRASEKEWLSILEIVEQADTLLMIDCIRLDLEPDNSLLRQQIEKDKKLIYERTAQY